MGLWACHRWFGAGRLRGSGGLGLSSVLVVVTRVFVFWIGVSGSGGDLWKVVWAHGDGPDAVVQVPVVSVAEQRQIVD